MRTTVRRGRVILAAAAAATLAACGDDVTAAETEAGSSGGSGGVATTSTSGEPTTPSATGSASSSLTTSSDGSTTSSDDSTTSSDETTLDPSTSTTSGGGSTDSGDSSSTGDPAVSLTPEEVCPFDVLSYDTAEHAANPVSPGQAVFAGPASGEGSSDQFYLMEGSPGDDQLRDNDLNDSVFPCVVAGDGDDLIEWELGEGGEGMSYATISGGLGADVFAYRAGGLITAADTPVHIIVDFEPGVDRIELDATLTIGVDAQTATVSFIDDFAGGVPDAAGLVIDNANGDVWLAADNGETLDSVRMLHLDGEVELEADDVSVIETIPGCDLNQAFPDDFRDGPATGEAMAGDNPTSAEATTVSSSGVALGSPGSDTFIVSGGSGPKCMTGGDGDDILRAQWSAVVGDENPAVLAGGSGSDTFVVSIDALTGEVGALSPLVVGDFEPAVDTLVLDPERLGLGESGEATVTFIDNFGSGSAAPTDARSAVVDPTDGEVWLSAEGSSNLLIARLEGAPAIAEADVEVISPSDP